MRTFQRAYFGKTNLEEYITASHIPSSKPICKMCNRIIDPLDKTQTE